MPREIVSIRLDSEVGVLNWVLASGYAAGSWWSLQYVSLIQRPTCLKHKIEKLISDTCPVTGGGHQGRHMLTVVIKYRKIIM
jgi:hypothetical protein